MAEGPKANSWGKTCKNELKELGDKCKGVIRENLFGNERDLPQKTKRPKTDLPQRTKDRFSQVQVI